MGPNTAFLLLIFGVLSIYGEFLRPGRLLLGLLGSVMTITGAYWLWRNSPQVPGISLVLLAMLMLMAEARWESYFLYGTAGTLALIAGFSLLFPSQRAIAPALAIFMSLMFGGVSIFLAFKAKRARRNKRADL